MVALFLSAGTGYAEEVAGRASVIDGDTIEIRGQRIRLFGIDAPESGQFCEDTSNTKYRCGQRSALALDAMLRGRIVHCVDRGRDRYDRMIAVCRSDYGDVAEAMVLTGMALAYRRYSTDYVWAERVAQSDGLGLWQGAFDAPWTWRKNE